MTDHRKAFLKQIEEQPFDDTTRQIFADWLDEQGEHEESERQRKMVASLLVLERYADRVGQPLPFDDLMNTVEWWKDGVLGKSKYSYRRGPRKQGRRLHRQGQPWIGFGTNFAQDELHDPENRREFWEAFEVVTGIQAPEDLRKQEWYSCAC